MKTYHPQQVPPGMQTHLHLWQMLLRGRHCLLLQAQPLRSQLRLGGQRLPDWLLRMRHLLLLLLLLLSNGGRQARQCCCRRRPAADAAALAWSRLRLIIRCVGDVRGVGDV